MKTMIAFGAGSYYEMNREEIERKYNIVAICDNAKEKVGKIFHGKPVITVENISDYEDVEIVITTPIYQYEIIHQLIEMGIKVNKICTVGSEWMRRRCDSIQVIEEGIKVCIDGREMIITNALEEMICKEVWEGEDYNINLQGNSIVLDIGMNVGYATLFFANKPFVKNVYAFEPDRRVYVKAEKNIKLNSGIEEKIKVFNVACSDCNKEEEYVINERESAGIYKLREGQKLESVQKEIIKCVDSAEAIGNIINNHFAKDKIVVKCDCEGAEYEILNRLEEFGYLKKIDAFVMEWHLGRREEIEAIFDRNNYTYHIFTTPGRSFGKCYAFRCR